MIMNNELGSIWQDPVAADFKLLFQPVFGGTEVNHDKLRIADLQANNRTLDFPSMKHDCRLLNRNIWLRSYNCVSGLLQKKR